MYHGIYFFWGLLPFCLLCLSFWAVLKKWFRVHGREDGRNYFLQFVFCAICLALAIIFDQYALEGLVDAVSGGMFDAALPRFFLYPTVLLLGAHLPNGKKQKPTASSKFVFSN